MQRNKCNAHHLFRAVVVAVVIVVAVRFHATDMQGLLLEQEQ